MLIVFSHTQWCFLSWWFTWFVCCTFWNVSMNVFNPFDAIKTLHAFTLLLWWFPLSFIFSIAFKIIQNKKNQIFALNVLLLKSRLNGAEISKKKNTKQKWRFMVYWPIEEISLSNTMAMQKKKKKQLNQIKLKTLLKLYDTLREKCSLLLIFCCRYTMQHCFCCELVKWH